MIIKDKDISCKMRLLINFFSRKYVTEILVLSVVISFHAWSLMRYPSPFVDEAWFACRAWNFIGSGQAVGTLDLGVFDRFPGFETYFPWLPVVIQSIALRFYTTPELLTVRLVSLFFGILLCIEIYTIGVKLGGRRLGLLSSLILAFSLPFLYSAHLARYDIMVAAFGFGAYALYFTIKNTDNFLAYLFIGLLTLLAFEIHPNGAIYTPVLFVLLWSERKEKIFKSNSFWGFVIGAILGGLFYLERHVIHYPETYRTITQLAFSATHVPPIFTFDLKEYINGLASSQYLFTFLWTLLPVTIMGCVHLVVSVRNSPTPNDRNMLIFLVSIIIAYSLWIRNKNAYYAIIASPVLIIVSARYLINSWQLWKGRWSDYASRIAWGVTIVSIIGVSTQLTFNAKEYIKPAEDRIALSIQPGDIVMGSQVYWFGLYQHRYYSWETIIYFQRLFPGSSFSDSLMEFHPDIFILDGHMYNFFNNDITLDDSYLQHLHVPLQEVREFLEEEAILTDSFTSPIYGIIEIYRINWDK